MRKVSVLTLIAILALSACASEPEIVVKWAKPGASYDGFVAVHGQCVQSVYRESRAFFIAGVRDPGKGSGAAELVNDIDSDLGMHDPALGDKIDPEMFRRCMNGHGWHVNPKGFAPPEGDEVAMGY